MAKNILIGLGIILAILNWELIVGLIGLLFLVGLFWTVKIMFF